MFKRIRWGLTCLVTVTAGLIVCSWPSSHQRAVTPFVPTTSQIRAMSELSTLRVSESDLITVELKGWTGSVRMTAFVRGEATLGVDLDEARIVEVDPTSQRCTLTLPLPSVLTVRFQPSQCRIIAIDHDGLWAILPGDGGSIALLLGRIGIEFDRSFGNPAKLVAYRRKAQSQAEEIVHRFGQAIGWTVECRWGSP